MIEQQAGTFQSAIRPTLRSRVADLLDRATFGMLTILAAAFAFELRYPVVQTAVGLILTSVELLIVLVLSLWIMAKIAGRALPVVPPHVMPALLAWLVALLISALVAPGYQSHAFLFICRVLAGIAIGWSAFDLARDSTRQRMLIVALVGCGTLVALIGLAEGSGSPHIVAWLASFKVAPTRIGDVVRISSTLSYATIAAMVLELVLPLALTLALISRRARLRWWAAAAVGLMLFSLVLTLSRAGVLALLGAFGLMALYSFKWKLRLLMAGSASGGIAVVGLVLLILIWNPLVALRFSTESEQSWYRAAYEVKSELHARPNQVIETPLLLTNTGARTWEPCSDTPFQMSYHLYDTEGEAITYDGLRSELPDRVGPGESVEIMGSVAAPAEPGTYRVEWDLLQEEITWFSWKGTPTASSRLIVLGVPVSSAIERSNTRPPTDIRIIRPTLERSELWGAAIQMVLERPLFGVGPDTFRWRYGTYLNLDEWNTSIHANNLYLEWLADTGVIGLAMFLWFSWKLFTAALPGPMAFGDDQDLIRLALLASLVTWYVHGLFDYFYEFTPTYVAFWLIAGLTLRLGQGSGYAHWD